MRSIHIYCDGGFGNRFNGLVAGLIIAKAANLKPVIVWPRNNWCGAAYSDLFEKPALVIERELVSYVAEKEDFQFFMTEDHLNMGVVNQSPLQTNSLQQALDYLGTSTKDIHFHSPLIPAFLDSYEVNVQLKRLPLHRQLVAKADDFMAQRQLKDFFGIHIRKTDFGAGGSDDVGLFQLLSNCPGGKFFVCSDDESVEIRFSSLANVSTYPKRAYVQPLVEGDWNTPTEDQSGRLYACNVDRSATSVEDAAIDLLILSRSQIVDTSRSTFRNMAMLLQAANLLGDNAASKYDSLQPTENKSSDKRVAVFIPVFNEEKYIRKTIESILAQDYLDFDLIVSENHSSDKTMAIVVELGSRDSRIKVIRPPEKLNSISNFAFALDFVNRNNYFASMMLGGHDLIANNVLSSCVRCLEENPATAIALQENTFEIDELDNVTRKWPRFHQSGHMNRPFDATLTLMSLMYNTPMFGLWRQDIRRNVQMRFPCVGADHLYIAEAASQGMITFCHDSKVYLRRSPITDNYLDKHFVDASGDAAAAADMATQLSWLSHIIESCTVGYPEYAKALHKNSAVSLYLLRYNHHFQTFGSNLNSALNYPTLSAFIQGQLKLSQETLNH